MAEVTDKVIFLSNSASDDGSPFTDGNREMRDAVSTGNVGIVMGPLTQEDHGWIYEEADWNNDAWNDGTTSTFAMNLSSTNSDFRVRARIVSLSATNTILQRGAQTAFQVCDQDRSYSITSPTWTHTEACGNRLGLELDIEQTAPHGGDQSFAIDTANVDNSTLTSGIVFDTDSCTGGGATRRIFIID